MYMFCGNRDEGDTKQTWAVYITKPRLLTISVHTYMYFYEIQSVHF